jgi:Cytochrome c554 and c-prime
VSYGAFLLCTLFLASSSGWNSVLEPPSSAEICGACHRAIEDGWKHSAHSQAVESRLFQDALEMAEEDFGASTRRTCLGCHSPIAVQIGDLKLIRKVSWEGVTCDYCHSIRNVSLGGANPKAQVDFSLVKSGPWKEVESPAHATEYSAIHTTSVVCAPCHEYRDSLGFAVLTTYSEWKASSYAKAGEGCQSCHMYQVEGAVVDARVKKVASHEINLHEMPGSHSIEQLNKALRTQLTATHDGNHLRVIVKLTNRGAGHSVPTGSPLRKLILEVRANPYSGSAFRQERVFQRTVVDQKGKVLNLEPLAFVKAARVLSDTRLAANETRTEIFDFPVPQGVLTQVEVNLYYYYSPMATTAAQQEVKFFTIRRLVR